ncbi:MAG TPA: hypothetical protein VGN35_06540 [Jatrophihabitantaceae bacterium]|nr:hypothetical protein [Jatrophihabitantaceae bacterium]
MGEPVDPNPQHDPYQPSAPWAPPGLRHTPAGYGPPAPYPAPPGYAAPLGYAAPPGYPVPPPPNTRRPLVLIVVGLLVLVVVGVATAIALRPSSRHADRVPAPSSFGAYHRLDTAQAGQVEQSIRSFGNSVPAARSFYDAASIATYASDGTDQPSLILVVVRASTVAAMGATGTQATVDNLLAGSTTDSERFAPGPNGGAMNCGGAQFGATSETMCAWADAKTVGLVLSLEPPLDHAAAAAVTLAARAVVD